MAAAYQTGTATGVIDLLQKLVTFLAAQGWATESSVSSGAGWRAHMSKSGVYANFRAYVGGETNTLVWPNAGNQETPYYGIAMNVGSGYSGAASWHSQAGVPTHFNNGTQGIGSSMWVAGNTVTQYHFFDDGSDNIIVAVEGLPGVWVYLLFGVSMSKAGSWTGGPYFCSSGTGYYLSEANGASGWESNSPPPFARGGTPSRNGSSRGYVRADVSGVTPPWSSSGTTTSGAAAANAGNLCSGDLAGEGSVPTEVPSYPAILPYTGNAMNGRTVLLPVHVYVARATSGWSLLGEIPSVFVGYGDFTAAAIYSIGAEDYFAIPTNIARLFWFVRKWA